MTTTIGSTSLPTTTSTCRQYYNREYETTTSRPPSPVERRKNKAAPMHTFHRRPSPSRSRSPVMYRRDYSRAQHNLLAQQEQQEQLQERLRDNIGSGTSTNTQIMTAKQSVNDAGGTGSNDPVGSNGMVGSSGSPDSVVGLNVRDLASRYGGGSAGSAGSSGRKNHRNHAANDFDTQYRRKFSRSPLKVGPSKASSTMVKSKVDEHNIDGGVECTLAQSNDSSEVNDSNDTTKIYSSHIRRHQRSSRSPTLGRSARQGRGAVSSNEFHEKNDSVNHEEQLSVQKKWGWPSPVKRHQRRNIDEGHTNSYYDCNVDSTSHGQRDYADQSENYTTMSSKAQYLQVLKQSRNPKSVDTTTTSNDSADSNNYTLVEQSTMDSSLLSGSILKSYSPPEMKNYGQNRWGRPSRSSYKASQYSLNESNDVIESTKAATATGSGLNKQGPRVNVQIMENTSNTTEALHSSVDIESNQNSEKKNVLEKAHFWRDQLTNHRSRTRSPIMKTQRQPRKLVGEIKPSKSSESLEKKEVTKEERSRTRSPFTRKPGKLIGGIQTPLSSDSFDRSRSPITNSQRQTVKTIGEIQQSRSMESFNKKELAKVEKAIADETMTKNKSPSNGFSSHVQYMQSKSQSQHLLNDDLSPKYRLKSSNNEISNSVHSSTKNWSSSGGDDKSSKMVERGVKGTISSNKRNYLRKQYTLDEQKFSTSGNTNIDNAIKKSNDEPSNRPTIQDQDLSQEEELNENEIMASQHNSFEKYQSQFQLNYKSLATSQNKRNNEKKMKEKADSPVASLSSSYDEKLRQSQGIAQEKSFPVTSESNTFKQQPIVADITNELSTQGSRRFDPKLSIASNLQAVDYGVKEPRNGISTPTKKLSQNPSDEQDRSTFTVTPRRTTIEKLIEGHAKPPNSVSPSRRSLHERIRKFDTGGEVPMPLPHNKVEKVHYHPSPRHQYHKLESPRHQLNDSGKGEKDESILLEERNSFKPILNVSESADNFEEDKIDYSETIDNAEEATVADYSLSLSVSEAKARLWDTNEKLQAWPKNDQNEVSASVPVPAPSPPSKAKPNFKSKLFVRAAEAAQTIRKTSSSESWESYKPGIRHSNNVEDLTNSEKNVNNVQSHALSPQASNPQSGYPHALNPRQQVKQSIQNKSLKDSKNVTKTPVNHDESKNNQKIATSIAELMAKLASVKRDDPTAALKAIDSILQSERRELGIIEEEEVSTKSDLGPSQRNFEAPKENKKLHNEAMSEKDDLSSYDSESDDSTVSAITDPTYQSGFADTSSVFSYSTVSRNGKKRQFSYHVTKDGAFHQQHSSNRISSSHYKNKKQNGCMLNHQSKPRGIPRSYKGPSALDTSFDSEAKNSSETMISPPAVERTMTSEKGDTIKSRQHSPEKKVRGGMSVDNQCLLRKINTWDESYAHEKKNSRRNASCTSPACSERIKGVSSKENLSPGDKIKKLARVADERGEISRRNPSPPGRRFFYPSNNTHSNQKSQEKQSQGSTELPENVASAFDDVNISFGSQNIYPFQREMNYSYLSPLAEKFSKVEQRYENQDP